MKCLTILIYLSFFAFVLEGKFVITKDNLVATLPQWGNHFDISLELWIESYTSTNIYGWSEILRFTSTNQNCCSAGDRIPAIFANKNGYIYVVSQVGTNANAAKAFKIKTKTWTKVEIKQYEENGEVFHLNFFLTISTKHYVYSGSLKSS